MTAKKATKKVTVRSSTRTDKADGEAAVVAKIAAMPEPFSAVGMRLHALILRSAPTLKPATWYGMPAYAKNGKTICFFRADKKYMTQDANLIIEEGSPHQLIESAWYFTGLDEATEAKLAVIVRRAAS